MPIRPATAADAARVARICLLTGAVGADATGVFCDDTALADVFATPYLHGPGGFCLVWDVGGGARGYVLGTDDTRAFQEWFVDQWWPRVGASHERRTEADGWLLSSAPDPNRMVMSRLDLYPAHLHIDLLPDAQGRGAGRALIEAACELLASRGSPGVHLVAERANTGAQAFYSRVGFEAIGESDTTVTYGRKFTG